MSIDDDSLIEFGRLFREFVERSLRAAPAQGSELIERLRAHLGADPTALPVVAETYAPFDHANVQVAVDAYLAEEGRAADLIGLAGSGREHHSLTEMLQVALRHGQFDVGAVDYAAVPVGVGVERPCVQFGCYLVTDGDTRYAVAMRGADRFGRPAIRLEVLAPDPAVGQRVLSRVRELMARHNVFRGQVVSFEPHEFGHGVGPIRFHTRPDIGIDDVILPPGALDAVDRQVVGVARHRAALREAGHALKRGVLLFGPPGTGKTHTVRYLLSRLPEFTVILLSGMGLEFIQQACGLARLVQPALIVMEDVDLVAEARGPGRGMENPLLYQVLNEMDGLGGDADVAFLLTTNRADLLEPALAERPGRVDLAVEVPLPDGTARERLLRLYGRGLDLTPAEVAEVVASTAGMTAAFFAELARQATLLAAIEGTTPPRYAHVQAALTQLAATRAALAPHP